MGTYRGYIVIPEPRDMFFLRQVELEGRGYKAYFSPKPEINTYLSAVRNVGEVAFVLTDYGIDGRPFFGAEVARNVRGSFGRDIPIVCFPERDTRVPKQHKRLFDRVYAKNGSSLLRGEEELFKFLEKMSST